MSAAELEREFEASSERLPGGPETLRRRRAALEEFMRRGFPTRRDEDWRYTDLKAITSKPFAYGGAPEHAVDRASEAAVAGRGLRAASPGDARRAPAGRGKDAARASRPALDALLAAEPASCARIVFVDGRLDEASSRLASAAGVDIVRLATDAARLGAALAPRPALEGHPLAALNTAFAADGVAIRVAKGTAVERPLLLYFVGGESGLAEQLRIAVDLEPGASLRLVVHGLDADAARPAASWRNVVTHVVLGEGARLALHRLQEYGAELLETSLLAAELGKDARLEAGLVDVGGRLVRNELDVRLLAPGAEADLFGVFVAGRGSHIDDHMKIEHVAPHTRSDAVFRGIADAGGHGVFDGKVIVHPGAERTDARQSSNNLLLADGAEIDTKPTLEIYADDVKCTHGATIGELDAEQLFYLRSRGIDEPAARALLTFAFANAVLARLEPDELGARAVQKVAGRLPGGSAGEIPNTEAAEAAI